MTDQFRLCTWCGEVKPIAKFYKAKEGRYLTGCRSCRSAYTKARRAADPEGTRAYANEYNRKNPEKRAKARRKQHLKLYGITPNQFEDMMAAQGESCAICSKPLERKERGKDSASVDHDHVTGEVREILCGNCNTGLGYFLDNPDLLAAAAFYLMRHQLLNKEK